MRRLLDRLSTGLARLLLSVFFHRIELEGVEKVPRTGPLLVVANHPNGLIDPVLLFGLLPRPVRFLGKSTLWDMIPLRPFLALGGVIPIYRPSDPGIDPSKNVETFSRCHRALLRGEAVALFPEGTSHAEPSLRPLKTGAARIALGAAAEARAGRGGSSAGTTVAVLPVGLTFDARERFRSAALVTIGDPLDVAPGTAGDPLDPRRVRGLTEAIRRGLRAVHLEHGSWREARLFQRAVEIYDRPARELPGDRSLAETHRIARELVHRFAELQRVAPEETARVARAMDRYDRILGFLALRDDQVAARYPLLGVLRWTLRTLAVLLFGLPLAAVGILLNALPYLVVGRLADRPDLAVESRASWKLFGGIFAYPVLWSAQALAAGRWLGADAGLAVALSAPLTGSVALVFWERGERFLREARAYLTLRTR
ncbi:MAG: 1-acyl-sn-glycerol-3-phosphate acyltransferase, partial [Acidobacteriota bacterium]